MVTVLASIHFHAGNVRAATAELSNQTEPVLQEELEFDFRTVRGTGDERSAYFSG
jgi:hypothetical protein